MAIYTFTASGQGTHQSGERSTLSLTYQQELADEDIDQDNTVTNGIKEAAKAVHRAADDLRLNNFLVTDATGSKNTIAAGGLPSKLRLN